MEVETMKKTEYLALHPAVDPLTVSQIGNDALAAYCRSNGVGFMMEKGKNEEDYQYWVFDSYLKDSAGAIVGYCFLNGELEEVHRFASRLLLEVGETAVMVDRDVFGTRNGFTGFETKFHVVA